MKINKIYNLVAESDIHRLFSDYYSSYLFLLPMIGRACKHCGTKMKGRADKQFCNYTCKNAYNYEQKQQGNPAIKAIDKILHKNHDIMVQIFKDEKRKYFKMPKLILSKMGFDFSYHTGIYLNSKGKTYHYVYDYAWMEFSNQEIMVVRGKGVVK